MARRYDHSKEELKELIFTSAKKIVKKKGYSGLSARKLAEKIGYTPGTIYSFYKNLDDLVMHINASTIDEIYKLLQDEIAKCKKPDKEIQTIAKVYVDYSSKNHNLWELLFDYRYKKDFKIPKWYQEKVQRSFDLVAESINKYCTCSKECKKLARVLWAGLNGIIVLSSRNKLSTLDTGSMEALIESFCSNFLKGLKSSKS